MKNKFNFLIITFLLFSNYELLSQNCNKWVLGYLPTYHQGSNGNVGNLNSYDFSRLTHVGHHGPYLNPDGSLDYNANHCTPAKMAGAVQAAHLNGKPIMISIVSWISYMQYLDTPTKRTTCINELLHLVDTYGYDGVDVDLEPVMSPYVSGMQTDNPIYYAFVSQLYDSLAVRYNAFLGRQPLLTCAVNSYGAPILHQLENKFDMINIMTYDMTNSWIDYNNFTWHDSPVFDYGNGWPSVHGMVQEMLQHEIPASKIGIGVSFDAFRWKGGAGTPTGGVTAPAQTYTTTPSWTRFSYENMMDNVYNQSFYRWDSVAKMSYLSINNVNDADDEFWSYNDEASCEAKAQYVLDNNLGGVILWELYLGLRNSLPATNHIPQLKATWDVLCNFTTTINETRLEKEIVYPNPFNKSFFVKLNNSSDDNYTVELYDIVGKNMNIGIKQHDDLQGIEVMTSEDLNPGLYFLKITNNTKTSSVVVVKM